MHQDLIAVIKDAKLDNNLTALNSLSSLLAIELGAKQVGVDAYGIFAEFNVEFGNEDLSFRLRYIEVEHPFWMAEFLTTQEFYELVMKENPSDSNNVNGINLPVGSVSYNRAINFCEKLSLYFNIAGMSFDLPSKDEWLAAKPYNYENFEIGRNYPEEKDIEKIKQVAWYRGNSNNFTQPVGQKQGNINGLYDLLGNVWEWTKTDHTPFGFKIFCGGSCLDYLLSESAYSRSPGSAYVDLGFRFILRYN